MNKRINYRDLYVHAGEYVSSQFNTYSNGYIYGNFTVSNNKDIIVLILDDASYVKWSNGYNVSSYYNSGRVTNGNITVTLPEGKYYLIYSNKFDTISNKTINNNVIVSYNVPKQILSPRMKSLIERMVNNYNNNPAMQYK